MKDVKDVVRRRPWFGWVLFFATIVVVVLIGLLTTSILERRTEAQFLDRKKIPVQPLEPRNAVWGINYPREYNSYRQTADSSFRSKYNGNVMIDMLEQYPALVVLWAGYGFSKDYNQARGHMYAIKDIRNTLRTGGPEGPDQGPMPSTCWTCKSPDVPRVMDEVGVADFYAGKWARLGPEIVNPIGCSDCHDENTMDLRITRPALIEAFDRMGKDINEASHQEMRSLVCAQCHVEYYFNKETPVEGVPYLTFPWDKGLTAEDMEAYYDAINFSDWTHALSRAPMIKAQHPGYETYTTGIHARRGVSCADCHMPYKSEGGVKYTDHHIMSPLDNVSNSCQVCHRESEEELVNSVYANMDRVIEARAELEHLLRDAHIEAKYAWDNGASEEMMDPALMDIRHAQWRWDYSAAAHGAAAHAPVEILRTISHAIKLAQDARIKIYDVLHTLGIDQQVPIPDLSTKEKAQAFVGWNMEELQQEKKHFLHTVVPEWDQQAAARERAWPQYDAMYDKTLQFPE